MKRLAEKRPLTGLCEVEVVLRLPGRVADAWKIFSMPQEFTMKIRTLIAAIGLAAVGTAFAQTPAAPTVPSKAPVAETVAAKPTTPVIAAAAKPTAHAAGAHMEHGKTKPAHNKPVPAKAP